MKLSFTTLQGEPLTLTVTKPEYAQLLERFTVRGAQGRIPCSLCPWSADPCPSCRLASLDQDKNRDWHCRHLIPGLNAALDARIHMRRADHEMPPADVATLRNFRRFIRRAAARGAK